jgi:hypothetical protein
MFPEYGPVRSTTSKAEQRLYALLAAALGDEYSVFHGVRWETKEEGDKIAKRESDFLVISRVHGLLILEAKGGHIRRGEAGRWFTKQRAGKHVTRDPFEQARTLVPLLRRHLWTAPLTRPYAPAYRIGYGVWFPDTEWQRGGADNAEDALVLDRRDLEAPEDGILRVYAHFEGGTTWPPLAEVALAALLETLAPTVRVQSRLAAQLEGEARRIQELTDEQFQILTALGRYRRLAISGAAGTGKTVLAYEKARRLAAQGLDTLLLCSNPSLAAWLELRAKQEPADLRPHLAIRDIGALCAWVVSLARTLKPKPGEMASEKIDDAEGLPTQLAPLLVKSIQTLERRGERMPFDAILVDEAQDLDPPLWSPLTLLLRDRDDGLLYIFYDEAQRETDGPWRVPLPGDKALVPLVANLRNTRAIFDVMMRFYRGPDAPICRGPEGRAPMYLDPAALPVTAGEDAEVTALRLALDHLVEAEGIAAEDILVITCRSQRSSRWYRGGQRTLGAHRLIQRPEGGRPGRVSLATVRSAKGLERTVVVLTELDGLDSAAGHNTGRDTLLYVALSRAVHHLVVLGPERTLHLRKDGRHPGDSGVLAVVRGGRLGRARPPQPPS